MSITPQAIKDQEFQVKFRGYDTIEVKAYLELLAEEFFELHEVRRRQEDDYAELYEEVQVLRQERESLQQESRQREERSEKSVLQFLEKDEMIVELQKQIETLEQEKNLQREAWERQEGELREEVDQLRGRLDQKQHDVSENSGEVEKLRGQIELLERQIGEFKKEELDFKTALVAAQRFADDVRSKAKDEAEQMIEQAINEVETYRKQSEEELAHLPREIEQLRRKKVEVRDELKAVLSAYLRQLDNDQFPLNGEGEDSLSELFQSIPLDEDAGIAPAEIEGFEDN